MSAKFKRYLFDKGIASSRTTSYNPATNGQVERLTKHCGKLSNLE